MMTFEKFLAANLAAGHQLKLEKRVSIFRPGEEKDLFYLVLEGYVGLFYLSADGEEVMVDLLSPGEVIGPEFGGIPQQSFSARAFKGRCKVVVFTRPTIMDLLAQLTPEKVLSVGLSVNNHWQSIAGRLVTLMSLPVKDRAWTMIGWLAEKFGLPDARGRLIPFGLSHEDMAVMVAASRPMVSKVVKSLVKRGRVIRESGRYILPSQQPRLRAVGERKVA
jgi:CRP/FNR family transcriptional regulator